MEDRAGFTLVEALVAMILSTLVVGMVASVFLVQNEFYADALTRSTLQGNVREAASLVTSHLRGVSAGGILAAETDSVSYRTPLVVGGVCGVSGSETYLHLPVSGGGFDPREVAGYAVRDASGSWSYTAATWASLFHSAGEVPAQVCASAGADTTGAIPDFFRLDGLTAPWGLGRGDLVMLYGEQTLKVDESGLDPGSMALFVGFTRDTLREFASGLSARSAFRYQLSTNPNWRDRVRGGNLSRIRVIRFLAQGKAAPARVGREPISFDLTVTVPLRNAN